MREKLFRGKIKPGLLNSCNFVDEWVEGDFVHDLVGNPMIEVREYPKKGRAYLIREETFGEYTGLKDKNSKMIFEGDIVKFFDNDWCDHTSEVVWGGEYYPAFDINIEIRDCANSLVELLQDEDGVEVIGNIHDNPELVMERKYDRN